VLSSKNSPPTQALHNALACQCPHKRDSRERADWYLDPELLRADGLLSRLKIMVKYCLLAVTGHGLVNTLSVYIPSASFWTAGKSQKVAGYCGPKKQCMRRKWHTHVHVAHNEGSWRSLNSCLPEHPGTSSVKTPPPLGSHCAMAPGGLSFCQDITLPTLSARCSSAPIWYKDPSPQLF